MAEALKLVYSEAFIDNSLSCWSKVAPQLNKKETKAFILSDNWENLELKERSNRLTDAMHLVFPQNFEVTAPLLYKLIEIMEANDFPKRGYEYIFIPDYVANFGLKQIELALPLLARITQFVSCEFAIRPFILNYEQKTMQQMQEWSKSKHTDIRRLASEGCRPRLPWAMALPRFKKDASLILPILENLKADASLYVRKSVANNLNDISKDQAQLTLALAKKWQKKHKHTDWIIKHGMRTLLKAGNPKAMELFGYTSINSLSLLHFKLHTKKLTFGNQLHFSFSIRNKTSYKVLVRIEYKIYFMKANGKQTPKVFKISERQLESKQNLDFTRKHSIKPISTRKYYSGEHLVAIVINGVEFEKQSFLLDM